MAAQGAIDAQDERITIYFGPGSLCVDGERLFPKFVRSKLLQGPDFQSSHVTGDAHLPMSKATFSKWYRFSMSEYNEEHSPEDLVQLLRAATYLIDREGEVIASRRLAAAIRAPLRSSLRLIKTLPSIRLPACPECPRPPGHRPGAPAPLLPAHRYIIPFLDTLTADSAAAVLSYLHPLELLHLPPSLLLAGLAPYATPTHSLDLRDPLLHHAPNPPRSSALPLWCAECNHFLAVLAEQPGTAVPALQLSYINAITSATLRIIAASIHSLDVFSPQAIHLSFLSTATSLTNLSLVSAHAPVGNLLDALADLSHLRTLTIVLPNLSLVDTQLLLGHFDAFAAAHASFPSASRSGSSRRNPPPQPRVACALAGLKHAHLCTTSARRCPHPAWPPMLAHLLPISTLESLTCHPYTLPPSTFPLSPLTHAMRATPELPLRSLCLCWPDSQTDGSSGVAELAQLAGSDVSAIFSVAGVVMPLLDTVVLDCRECSADDLAPVLELTTIKTLRLEGLPVPVASAAAKWLQGLQCLQDLHIGLQPAAVTGDGEAPERLYINLVQDLRLQATQLTRLGISEVPVLPAACAAVGRLSGLRELSWTLRDGCAAGTPDGATAAAFAAMLRSCSGLQTLHIPFWPSTGAAGPVVAALALLRCLQEVSVTFRGLAGAADAPAESPAGDPPPASAAPVTLHTLEVLQVHLVSGHGEHLFRFVERLNWSTPALTALKLRCNEDLTPEDPVVLVDTLARVPQLRRLHLPGGCMADVAAFGPAISRLSKLQELVFWGSVGVVEESWRPLMHLPLGHGIVEISLLTADGG